MQIYNGITQGHAGQNTPYLSGGWKGAVVSYGYPSYGWYHHQWSFPNGGFPSLFLYIAYFLPLPIVFIVLICFIPDLFLSSLFLV